MSERAELSRKNPYWIPRHRYYELKHFCLQFRDYQHRCLELDGMSNCHPAVREIQNGVQSAGEFTVSQAIERPDSPSTLTSSNLLLKKLLPVYQSGC